MTGFEGSYMGADDRISPLAVMECKICWTPYDPDEGDDTRQIEPGTPFSALPQDWSCPNCGAPRAQFMVEHDPGAAEVLAAQRIASRTRALEAEFTEIWHGKMRDVPMVNRALRVEAVGFREWEGKVLGVLVSPWFMNLVILPGEAQDWSGLVAGEKEILSFPSGDYEFLHNTRGLLGGYKACSLFSPMGEFQSQMQAVEVARAVMAALFLEEHRAETDRAADIRAAREAELAAAQTPAPRQEPPEPSRRAVLTAGLSTGRAG